VIGHCVSPQPWREIDAHAREDDAATSVCFLIVCNRTVQTV